jgi:uncharacterized membrane protein YfbV (UPF0208 family)
MSTPEKRPVSFFSLFNRGQHYAKTWPLDKRLAPVFIENRIIRATRYAIRIMPPIAIFTLCWQIALAASWARRRHRAVCAEPADAGIMVVG